MPDAFSVAKDALYTQQLADNADFQPDDRRKRRAAAAAARGSFARKYAR